MKYGLNSLNLQVRKDNVKKNIKQKPSFYSFYYEQFICRKKNNDERKLKGKYTKMSSQSRLLILVNYRFYSQNILASIPQ